MVKLELNITPKLAKIGKKEEIERKELIVRIENYNIRKNRALESYNLTNLES